MRNDVGISVFQSSYAQVFYYVYNLQPPSWDIFFYGFIMKNYKPRSSIAFFSGGLQTRNNLLIIWHVLIKAFQPNQRRHSWVRVKISLSFYSVHEHRGHWLQGTVTHVRIKIPLMQYFFETTIPFSHFPEFIAYLLGKLIWFFRRICQDTCSSTDTWFFSLKMTTNKQVKLTHGRIKISFILCFLLHLQVSRRCVLCHSIFFYNWTWVSVL